MPKKPQNKPKPKKKIKQQSKQNTPTTPSKKTYFYGICFDLKPGIEGVPIFVYNHSEGPGAVIGGHVYRGQALRNLTGRYLFGDLFTKYEIAIYIITSTTWSIDHKMRILF